MNTKRVCSSANVSIPLILLIIFSCVSILPDDLALARGSDNADLKRSWMQGYEDESSVAQAGAPSKCDFNADGVINVLDIQLLINAILGIQPLSGADISGDSRVDVLDLQILCNVVFGLQSCPQSTGPLTVAITSPSSGSTVSGPNIPISASVTGEGIVGVQFMLGSSNLGPQDTVPPYETTWNTTAAANGNHSITAVVRDAAGRSTTSNAISVTTVGAPPGNASNWEMTFNDEFAGTSLALSTWATQYSWGRTNNDELEWYVDNANVVSNGTLKLIAKKESVRSGFPYTSGMISSRGRFSQMYGYFEARMKIPAGQGFWPAFWLMPAPDNWPPEIDVMENLGDDPQTIYMTHHYTTNYPNVGGSKAGQHGSSYTGPDFSAGFHTYGVEWSSSAIIWYIDGVEQYRNTEHVPRAVNGFTGMYMIANLAVGGSWPGSPDSSTVFPNQLEIDYIRAFRRISPVP